MSNSLTPVRVQHSLRREEGNDAREQMSGNASAKHPHISVLLKEVVDQLDPKKGEVVVDATFGAGGHARALKAAAKIKLIAIDADPAAGEGVIEANFRDLDTVLKHEGVSEINKVLFDLGWNKGQLTMGRGFSFMTDEPLHMSYGEKPASGFTAAEMLNNWSEKVLADVFFGYGEERYARRIAKAVVERRKTAPINTTIELVEIIRDAVPAAYRHGRVHPATKAFQALRIAVNDELVTVDKGVRAAWKHLAPGGRIAVITFHSIEDRVVKKLFLELAKGKEKGKLLTKKPIMPTRAEIIKNPSARSAKLRVIEKL